MGPLTLEIIYQGTRRHIAEESSRLLPRICNLISGFVLMLSVMWGVNRWRHCLYIRIVL